MFAPEGDLGRSNLVLIGFAYVVSIRHREEL
jgi:hypothetical protein